MATCKLNVHNGNGIKFDGNKITINYDTSSSYIKKNSDGLYVSNLKGPDGKNGGSVVDNYTIKVGSSGKLVANRDVVAFIWSMQTKSNVASIIADCNNGINNGINATSYLMNVGDLFMFRDNYHKSYITYSDDGNRYTSDTAKALFLITKVSMSGYKINSLTIKCIWSAISGWTAGTSYSG